MMEVARKILAVFPHLNQTRQSPEAPPEVTSKKKFISHIERTQHNVNKHLFELQSRFFWLHTGRQTGPHSGTVYYHLRHVERNLPEELHKFKRKRKQQEILPPLPDELYEQVEQLKMMEPSKANFRVISEAMAATFPLHHQMLVEHSTPGEIMDTFPRLVSYQGQMVICYQIIQTKLTIQQLFFSFTKHFEEYSLMLMTKKICETFLLQHYYYKTKNSAR